MDEILKEAQEANPLREDTSDTGTSKIPNGSSSGESPNLIEEITLLQNLLLWRSMLQVVHAYSKS